MTNQPPSHTGFTDDRARTYDERVRKHIPGYEILHALAETLLARELPAKASLLLVGTGTGTEITTWGPLHPGWRFVGTDLAAPMLTIAKEKAAELGLGDRVRLHAGDVADLPAEEAFDAATLMLVLHFVPEREQGDFLASIAERLRPGAPFLLANLFGDIASTRFRRLNEARKAWAIAKGLPPDMAEQFCDPTRPDMHIVPEERLKSLLREAGFIDVQRVYQALTVGLWFARLQR